MGTAATTPGPITGAGDANVAAVTGVSLSIGVLGISVAPNAPIPFTAVRGDGGFGGTPGALGFSFQRSEW